jgi:C4-dicarboxylate-specific signal transduction histidine kinase
MLSSADSNGSLRVAVVEDDPDLRAQIIEVLDLHGFRAWGCADGAEALDRLRRDELPSHAIVLDLWLAGLDGWGFRVAQRNDPALKDIPVVVISGDDSAQATAIDAEGFLAKPFEAEDLCRAVRNAVARKADERERTTRLSLDRLACLGLVSTSIAHEINGPLGSAVLSLEMAQRQSAGDGAIDGLLRRTAEGLDHISRIVHSLMCFAQAHQVRGSVDLNDALEAALTLTSHEITKRARLVRRDARTPLVVGDTGLLAQVFINILLNAVHALDERPASRQEISLSTRTDERGWAVVEIRDTGCGIPAAHLAKLYEPFFTTKAPGRGTGLGLHVCRSILSELGGDIEVQSEVGAGTVVRVLLPPSA